MPAEKRSAGMVMAMLNRCFSSERPAASVTTISLGAASCACTSHPFEEGSGNTSMVELEDRSSKPNWQGNDVLVPEYILTSSRISSGAGQVMCPQLVNLIVCAVDVAM